jgi:hypothetical protein
MSEGNEGEAAAETPRPRQPCGKENCCWDPQHFEPTVEPPRTATAEELAVEADPTWLVERHEKVDRDIAWHEAGHAVVACALGCDIRTVKCGTARGYSQNSRTKTDVDDILILMAGPLAESQVGHVWPVAHPMAYIAKARAGTAPKDGCDCCRVALEFTKLESSAQEVFELWMIFWRYVQRMLDDVHIRIAVANVAVALQRERLLTADRFNELVDVESLRQAYAELQSNLQK